MTHIHYKRKKNKNLFFSILKKNYTFVAKTTLKIKCYDKEATTP